MKMKKRWKFLLCILALIAAGFFAVGYFIVANEAPIITGEVVRNIEYKPGLKLDIYTPTQRVYDKIPVVIYIHGGAWISGLKEGLNFNRFNQAVNELRDAGYAIISIDYTLASANQSPFPACIDDAVDAVHWIYQNATLHHFDVNNVGLFGESAGAHIAMMTAYANYFKDAPQVHFNYVVDVYGPNQLAGVYHNPTVDTLYTVLAKLPSRLQARLDIAKYIFGFDPKQDSARALETMKMYSPYYHLTPGAPPTLIMHGDSDRIVPVEQSTTLHEKLDSLHVLNEIHFVKGADHAFAKATPDQKSEIQKWIVEFIERHYLKEHE
ncbi:MAG TPA: alpha/beta hydrolase [Cyclobacteriaceae bacterium]|nr:alpha/beta hydrolase [Cyclobacteriaceae bacterium]